MSQLPLDEVLHLRMQLRTDDQVHGFGLYYQCTSGYEFSTAATRLAGAFVDGCLAKLLDCLSESTTVEGVYVTHSLPETALPGVAVLDSQPGTRDANAMPPNNCSVVSVGADDVDLVRKGRIFVGGLAKGDVTNGHWDATFISGNMQLFATALKGPLTFAGNTYSPVIVCRVRAGVPVAPFAILATTFGVATVCYSQRRRNSKQLGTF